MLCTTWYNEGSRNFAVRCRLVFVHTLLHRSVDTIVLDLVFENFQTITVFDGRDAGLTAWSSKDVYARDLLDFCFYQVAMVRGMRRSD